MSPTGRSWLAGLEGGVKLKAYRDSAGIPTVGVGQTYLLTQGKRRRVEMSDVFATKGAALEAFDKVLAEFELAVDAATRDDITQAEFDAFVAFAYNIGPAGFKASTAVRRYNAYESPARVAEAMSWWSRADGQVSGGLMARRQAEIDAMIYADYHLQGDRRSGQRVA